MEETGESSEIGTMVKRRKAILRFDCGLYFRMRALYKFLKTFLFPQYFLRSLRAVDEIQDRSGLHIHKPRQIKFKYSRSGLPGLLGHLFSVNAFVKVRKLKGFIGDCFCHASIFWFLLGYWTAICSELMLSETKESLINTTKK